MSKASHSRKHSKLLVLLVINQSLFTGFDPNSNFCMSEFSECSVFFVISLSILFKRSIKQTMALILALSCRNLCFMKDSEQAVCAMGGYWTPLWYFCFILARKIEDISCLLTCQLYRWDRRIISPVTGGREELGTLTILEMVHWIS